MQRIFAFLIATAASMGIAFANPATNAPLAGEKPAQKEAAPATKDAKKPEPAPAKDARKPDAKADAKKVDAKADAKKADAKADTKKADARKEPMDINTASETELATLKGIGPVRAKAIVKARPYKGKDDLVSKKIIPEGVYNDIKEQIIAKQKA